MDYRAPVELIREKFNEILKQSNKWDGNVAALQVTDFKEGTMELRCLMSARSGGSVFDLRCEVREKLIAFLQSEHPEALPHARARSALMAKTKDPPGARNLEGAARKRAAGGNV